jgi:transposase
MGQLAACKDRVHLILRGHVHAMDRESGRRRRSYSPGFKAEVIGRCLQPGVSVASIALANGINANLLHRWIAEHRQSQLAMVEASGAKDLTDKPEEPAFVPMRLEATVASPTDIRIELRRAKTTVTVS